jgi:hypothetical protein
MEKLRTPSLQHLSRNWCDTPEKVSRKLISLAENPPTFSYAILYDLVRDLIVLHLPLDQVMEGIRRKVKRADVRDNFLELLPLIDRYFSESSPTFVQAVNGRMYPLARNLMIPFTPPLIYGRNGKLIFPWFSFWKTNPLSDERLSLFVTVVYEILGQDADLDNANFQILDFSAPGKCKSRHLAVLDAKDVPRLSDARKREMLAVFSEGFHLAKETLWANRARVSKPSTAQPQDDQQVDLFALKSND